MHRASLCVRQEEVVCGIDCAVQVEWRIGASWQDFANAEHERQLSDEIVWHIACAKVRHRKLQTVLKIQSNLLEL